MTQKEKLDMLAHQVLEGEAQMMAFILEYEYGVESQLAQMVAQGRTQCNLDMRLDEALD